MRHLFICFVITVLQLPFMGLTIAETDSDDIEEAQIKCEAFGFSRGSDAFSSCMQTEYNRIKDKQACIKGKKSASKDALSCRVGCFGKYGGRTFRSQSEFNENQLAINKCFSECNASLNSGGSCSGDE
jgi:hypothetical protein